MVPTPRGGQVVGCPRCGGLVERQRLVETMGTVEQGRCIQCGWRSVGTLVASAYTEERGEATTRQRWVHGR